MKEKITMIVFLLVTVISAFFISHVKVNYNLEAYLPENSEISEGLTIYYDEFGEYSYISVAFNETDISEALTMKNEITTIENVDSVIFVDDYFNAVTYEIIKSQLPDSEKTALDNNVNNMLTAGMSYPEIFIAVMSNLPDAANAELSEVLDKYVSEDEMKFQVIFSTSSEDTQTEVALNEVLEMFDNEGYEYSYSGNAASTIYNRNTIESEVLVITLVCVPLILLALLFLSKSYADIILFGIVVGVAIIINLGTNIIFPNISFITKSMAIVLQLAISLDYVIFFISSYHQERKEKSVDDSIAFTKVKTRKPILASALTTAVSFLALAFMRFTIGFDIGLVFAKSILISLLTTLFLLPILIKIFARLIDRTLKKQRHLPKYNFFNKTYHLRFWFLGLLFVVLAFSIFISSKPEYTYGSESFAGSKGTEYYQDKTHIEDEFGLDNQLLLIIPKNETNEMVVYQTLGNLEFVDQIQAGIYYKQYITDPFVLNIVTNKMYSENYALFKFNLNSEIEGEEAFEYFEEITKALDNTEINDIHIIGETSMAYSIKEVVSVDYTLVMIIAMLAIMIIILITFRNFFMPILLPLVIETSVLFTMALLYFLNSEIVFLSHMIVSAILLGVTIDYAILLSRSYLTARETMDKVESIKKGIKESRTSIITSATLFSISGLTVYLLSSIKTISQIGLIIAIGAIVSLFYVLLILPQLLSIFDKWICKSIINKKN